MNKEKYSDLSKKERGEWIVQNRSIIQLRNMWKQPNIFKIYLKTTNEFIGEIGTTDLVSDLGFDVLLLE